jgi:threonine dehydrogenase-like Zn-dependent dehydrogenase
MLSAYLKRNGSNGSCGKKEKDRTAHYELRYCPVPSLKGYPPNTILVRTIAASICGSDLFGLGGCPSCPEWRRPTSLFDVMPEKCGGSGHEAIGIIVDMIPPSSASSSCEMAIGQKVLAMSTLYMYKVDSVRDVIEKETGQDISSVYPEQCGAFAEYFISHVSTCVKLPDSIPSWDFDPRWYVLAQPLGTILHACQKLGSVIDANVAVVGQGSKWFDDDANACKYGCPSNHCIGSVR